MGQWSEPFAYLSVVSFSPIVLSHFADIEASQSIRAALLVLGQLIFGYILVDLVLPRHRGISEALMWAAPIGFAAFGVAAPILVSLGWNHGLTLSVGFLIAALLHFLSRHRLARSGNSIRYSTLFALLVFAGSLVNGGNNPILLVVGVLVATIAVYREIVRNYSFTLRVISFGLILFIAIWALNRISNSVALAPSLLRPLLYGTDDQIYSEQMASSIAYFGINDNTAAVGTSIHYHWLSLSWSGELSRIARLDTWTGTLHLVPYYFSGAIAASTAFAICSVRDWTKKSRPLRTSPYLSVLIPLVLFGSYSVLDDAGALQVNNTSNLGAHLWAVPLMFVLVHLQSRGSLSDLILVSAGSAALMLSKGPYAIPIAITVVLSCFAVCREDGLRRCLPQVRVACGALTSMSLIYWLFIRDESNSSYKFDFDELLSRFPQPLQDPTGSGVKWMILVVVSFLGWILIRFWVLVFLADKKDQIVGIVGVGLMASSFFTFILDGLGGTSYFLNASILNSSVLVLFVISTRLNLGEFFRDLCVGATVGITFLILRRQIPLYRAGVDLWVVVFPVVVLVAVSVRVSICEYRSRGSEFIGLLKNGFASGWGSLIIRILAVTSISVTSASFLFGARSAIVSRLPHSSSLVGEEELLELAEIRDLIHPMDIIATNRNLCPSWVQLRDCASNMKDPSTLSSHLFSAVINRRTLIDGPRFVESADYWETEYPVWLADRLDALYEFLSEPGKSSSQGLIGYGVDYVAVHIPSLKVALSNQWTTKSIQELVLTFDTKLETDNYLLIRLD